MFAKLARTLYVQVLVGLILGVLAGVLFPQTASILKPLGDLFINAIRMVIGPIVLCTIVAGIARVGDAKKVGRLGGKALLYFEAITVVALLMGMGVSDLVRPGVGINATLASLDVSSVAAYTKTDHPPKVIDFFMSLVPSNVVDSFVRADIIQILVFSVLLGMAISVMGEKGEKLTELFEQLGQALMKIVAFVMKLAPLAAFGAIAFTTGRYGFASLIPLAKLVASLYGISIVFIVAALGPIAWFGARVNIWKLIKYFREELLITLGTTSSEAVMPQMLMKLEALGCSKTVVGMIIPAGYSFNLAGSSIGVSLTALFIAQAMNIHLSFAQQAWIFAVFMFTSKGIAGVAGASLVVLASTLTITKVIPVEGMALILGVDRFQNEIRAFTNLVGNAVATIVLARSEGEFDLARCTRVLNGELRDIPVEPGGVVEIDDGVVV